MRALEIDLVVSWVDGKDLAWQAEQHKFSENERDVFSRDWGLMRYWFRGVEQNLPWIRKIHFVTWGHLPPWLNIDHPKLHVVNHQNYIPQKYLPVFSSIPIELHMHRIDGLAEHFIQSNDDFYFFDRIEPEEYFQDGLPCDYLSIEPITERCTTNFGRLLWNNLAAINRNFDLQECVRKNPQKWFNDCYSEYVRQNNHDALRWKHFSGFGGDHYPIPVLKHTYLEVWEKERGILHYSSMQKFRSTVEVTNWLMRYWQLASGQFTPYMQKGRRFVTVGAPEDELRDAILSADTRVLCVNEGEEEFDFEPRAAYIRSLFEMRLPNMSSFEKF